MKRFLIPALLFTSFTLFPLAGCVVHEHDDPHAYHHDEVIRHDEVVHEVPVERHDDDVHVDVRP